MERYRNQHIGQISDGPKKIHSKIIKETIATTVTAGGMMKEKAKCFVH